jgi:hypothetical protein
MPSTAVGVNRAYIAGPIVTYAAKHFTSLWRQAWLHCEKERHNTPGLDAGTRSPGVYRCTGHQRADSELTITLMLSACAMHPYAVKLRSHLRITIDHQFITCGLRQRSPRCKTLTDRLHDFTTD